jgi:hypothetical protein
VLSLSAACCLLAAALAGCASTPAGGAGGGDGAPGGGERSGVPAGGALPALNVTSPHPGGAAYVRDYAGVARDDPTSVDGVPTGLDRGPFQSCCVYSWVEASGLFAEGQLSAVRVNLTWTNTPQDRANLDVAVCIPWYCGFPDVPDQTDQMGEHTESFDLVSGGHRQFLDQGQPFLVGARYSNLVSAQGVPFTLRVEVVPVGDALALLDPYEVEVPANATLVAEMLAPFRGASSASVMVYGEDDRPLAFRTVEGAPGSRAPLVEGPGRFVVVPFLQDGSLVRLLVENATAEPRPARALQETFGTVTVAVVTDPAPQEGTFTFDAPPGSMDTFPWFLYDGPGAQVPGVAGGGSIALSSSSGAIAEVDLAAIGLAMQPFGQLCLTCNSDADWSPENYLDDDGRYQVAYESSQATGRFVLFTATYSR